MNDFLTLTGDQQRDKYVKQGLANELEIAADLIDSLDGAPFLGPLIKLGKLAISTYDYYFVKKVCRFLDASKGYTEQEFNAFYIGMNSHEREILSEFLINSISQADHRDKVIILGYIYKFRVKSEIDENMLFRLCTAVNRCYTGDLVQLLKYKEINVSSFYISDILFSVGLLANLGIDGGNASGNRGTRYKLNEIGEKLVDILEKEHWFYDKE